MMNIPSNAGVSVAPSISVSTISNGLFSATSPIIPSGYKQPKLKFSVQPIELQPIEMQTTIKIEDNIDPLLETTTIKHLKENVQLVDVNEIILDKRKKVIGYKKVAAHPVRTIPTTMISQSPPIQKPIINYPKNNLNRSPPPKPAAITLKEALTAETAKTCDKCEKLKTHVISQKRKIRTLNQNLRRKSKHVLRLKMMLILMKEKIMNGSLLPQNNLSKEK